MFFRIFVTLIMLLSLGSPLARAATPDEMMIGSVLKLKTYDRNSIDGSYSWSHYGSAVLIDNKRIITNAHVILDADGKTPTGYYEACRSESWKKFPTCFTVAKLISYDTIADLAILELVTPLSGAKWAIFADKKQLTVGTSVVVYGYPSIGGTSITRTEGKIGGFDDNAYKFDGTIDHGNSGGGAFSPDGKLIGIPYAVKSDNGMIGYIIPIDRVMDFMKNKTDNVEKYTTKTNASFAPYIKWTESLYKNPNLIKTKFVEIRDAEKSGFALNSVLSSISGDVFAYSFLDKQNRVMVRVYCTKDASITYKNPITYLQDGVISNNNDLGSKTISTGLYLDSEKKKYAVDMIDKKDTKGMKWTYWNFVNKDFPLCGIYVVATDGKNKDKTSYQKGMELAKKIKFFNSQTVQDSFSSPLLSVVKIPENFLISYIASSAWEMAVYIEYKANSKRMYNSDFDIFKFDDLDGYMNYGYSENKEYKWKRYGFDDFFDRYKTTGYTNVTDTVFTTKNGKKFIMTVGEYGDKLDLNVQPEKKITFFYPFVTPEGEYRAYRINFTLNETDDMDIHMIRQFVETFEFPGTSPFKN